MFDTILAQLQMAGSIAFGRRFSISALDRLIKAMHETQHEFGSFGSGIGELIGGPVLDDEVRRELHIRRFRKQALRAARETAYYRSLFDQLGLDPASLHYEDIARLPVTPKQALRNDPDAFVCRSVNPTVRTMTTGTTGWPTSVYFSTYELQVIVALATLSLLSTQEVSPEDIVHVAYSGRATHINIGIGAAFAKAGALVNQVGQVDPRHALKLLAEKRRLPGKKPGVSILLAYPSYLGALVEQGMRAGYRPDDFALEQVVLGGEMITEGLRQRCRQLFGPVRFTENYALTETLPFGATRCEQNHLHFEASHGLAEVINPETGRPCAPGELGTLVLTPFLPYRETTLLLRYDTQDGVRPLAGPLSCRLRNLPATEHTLGKYGFAVPHQEGWTSVRDVQEAIEAVEDVPLPARYGFRGAAEGVEVEVLVREDTPQARRLILDRLEERGVPVTTLRLVEDRRQLRYAVPVRSDLHEILCYDAPEVGEAALAAAHSSSLDY